LVLVVANRQIVFANKAAEKLMRASRGLWCNHGCINASDFMTARNLQSLMSDDSRLKDEAAPGVSIILRDKDGQASLIVHVMPLSPPSNGLLPGNERPVGGLFIVDCQRNTVDRVNVFAEYFDLTSAEARVLAQLISGEGLTVAARHLDIARSTARTHLARILEKTGTHRQAELVRLFFETTIPCEGYASATGKRRVPLGGPFGPKSRNGRFCALASFTRLEWMTAFHPILLKKSAWRPRLFVIPFVMAVLRGATVMMGRQEGDQVSLLANVTMPAAIFCDWLPNFDRRLIQRPRETFGCDAFTPNPGETCVLIITKALSGARHADLVLVCRSITVARQSQPQ
jgi:DNA-binding CsgD family transcriptional regulator